MSIQTILEFWFGTDPDDAAVAREKSALWWSKSAESDAAIRRRFGSLVAQAAAGELSDWLALPRGCLALILLTDQFPRNIHRDSAAAFAHDPKALAWCLEGIAARVDLELRPIERTFFYLPLEHAEALEHQEQSVKHFKKLVDSVSDDRKTLFEGYLDFALRHRDIIERFGRFPHRNKLLGRESSAEELAFLREPNSSF